MFISSVKKRNYVQAVQPSIYTRDRQLKYKTEVLEENEPKKISQGAVLVVCFLIVGLVFSACAGMLYFKSEITKVQIEINTINNNIRELEHENSALEVEKIDAVDIDKIKISAENMGMSLPKADQVMHVKTVGGPDATNLKND